MFHIGFHIFIAIILIAAWTLEDQRLRNKQVYDDSMLGLIALLFVCNLVEIGMSVYRIVH